MTANWKNRTLFHGDNLDFMRAMNSESVDLIATDPPFNKGRDFHATPDSLAAGASFQDRWSWENDVHQDWIDQLTDDHPALMEAIESAIHAHSEGMGAYMCFMAVRLLAMRRILKPTGSIYLHCDPTASHYLKAVMDAIFGANRFVNEIVWGRSKTRSSISKKFRSAHDLILFYGKGKTRQFEIQYRELSDTSKALYNKTDSRGNYQTVPLLVSGRRNGETGKVWRGIDPNKQGADGMHWVTTPEKLEQYEQEDRIFWPAKHDGTPRLKYYLDESPGVPVNDIWQDISLIPSQSAESMGYPTQKPLPLYERIIRASSNEGDIVLDPFCGCATTCVAAERLNRQWVGVDIWEKAHEVVIKRLHDEVGLFGEVHYTDQVPARTDDGQAAAPYLRVKKTIKEPPNPYKSRQAMYDFLLEQHGPKCQGCDRVFDDPRYLELDHNTPRSDGGWNHIDNRILLCGPCNRLKSNTYTLSGLRKENKKRGFMRG